MKMRITPLRLLTVFAVLMLVSNNIVRQMEHHWPRCGWFIELAAAIVVAGICGLLLSVGMKQPPQASK
jgi:hypothetical protein